MGGERGEPWCLNQVLSPPPGEGGSGRAGGVKGVGARRSEASLGASDGGRLARPARAQAGALRPSSHSPPPLLQRAAQRRTPHRGERAPRRWRRQSSFKDIGDGKTPLCDRYYRFNTYVYTPASVRMYLRAYVHTYVRTHHAHSTSIRIIRAHICTQVHVHAHTLTDTHTHTHT